MVVLGTIFFVVMATAAFLLFRNRLTQSRRMLWVLMLAVPFPYIATTAGWWTAELGRQSWLVYGMQRTVAGESPQVSAGDVVFTTLGFAGLYLLLGLLFVYQVVRILVRGPVTAR
jgi:cytochrome bd ubiquinol oxidase subunit I